MRILHIITGLGTGGAERALYNQLDGGMAKRYSNAVVALNNNTSLNAQILDLGVPVTNLNMRNGHPSFYAVMKIRRIINQFQPDIIQGWMYHGNLMATITSRLFLKKSIIVWNIRHSLYHLTDEKLLTQWVIKINRLLSAQSSAIVYNSNLSRSQHEAFGYYAKSGITIPNGFDLNKFKPNNALREMVRFQFGIPLDSCVIGHVARYHEMKDHANFLRAATTLCERHHNIHFLLCGREVTEDNPEIAHLLTRLPKDRLHLLGERHDVENLMTAIDIFCQSSWSESFPNVLGEAMSSAIPCVATDVGDSSLILGDTGVIVPPRDNISLAEGIEVLLHLPKAERQLLGQAARKRIIENFSIGAITARYSTLYSKLLESH